MYLSAKHLDKVRNIIANFEVAYRSYISSEFITVINTTTDFEQSLNNVIINLSSSGVILAGYLKAKASNIKGKHIEVYDELNFANSCFVAKRITEKHDVPDVSEIVAITYLYTSIYRNLISCFKTSTEFIQLSDLFHDKRNKLSHPGSDFLDEDDALNVICYISTIVDFLDDSYFWYKPKNEILKDIDEYLNIEEKNIIMANIRDMPFSNHKIICRDEQLKAIDEFIVGKPGYYKKSTTMCIYGYGGIGKTAIVLEYVRTLMKKVNDNNFPAPVEFVLFFSAKDVTLETNDVTGRIEKSEIKQGFKTFLELRNSIFEYLNITSFENFDKQGLVVIDNFESIEKSEKVKIREFIRRKAPDTIRFIVTSRNPEKLEENISIQEFDNKEGVNFIEEYTKEVNITIDMTAQDAKSLVDLSRGNTLVIVLSLHRLDSRNSTMLSIQQEFTQLVNINKIKKELSDIPPNAYEVISEFMYRNTFNEIVELFEDKSDLLIFILKIFAVIDKDIEVYTLSRLTNKDFREIENVLEVLCNYLIIQKVGEYYSINQFANKYIVDRFISNSIELERLSNEITSITRTIKTELDYFNAQINAIPELNGIISDWHIELFGDRISASKAFSIYSIIKHELDCGRNTKYYLVINSLQELDNLLKITVHPYISFQKARILGLFRNYNVSTQKHIEDENAAFLDTIQIIKWNYPQIKATKSYAATLWLYGIYLYDQGKHDAIRYLEDSKKAFEEMDNSSEEYYQCLSYLGNAYLYEYAKNKEVAYLQRARQISIKLKNDYKKYSYGLRKHSLDLAERLRSYGS